jgi:addiction module HigA family antidote
MGFNIMAKKLPPLHPGEILREEFLIPLELSAGALAKVCGVPRTRIGRLANEETGVTADGSLLVKGAGYNGCTMAQSAERLRYPDGETRYRQETG